MPHTSRRATTSSGSTERGDEFVTRLGGLTVSLAFLGSRRRYAVATLFRDSASAVSTSARSGFYARGVETISA
jgi:hypothetical protein